MFLTSPSVFVWDLAIALMLAFGVATIVLCTSFLRKRPKRHCIVRCFLAVFRLMTIGSMMLVLYGSFFEPNMLGVTRIAIALPIERPLNIVVLSDFHVGPYKSKAFIQRVVRQTNDLMPDIVILAGDYILQDNVTLAALDPISALKDLRPALGTFAVLGNHDHGVHLVLPGMSREHTDRSDMIADYLRQMHITVLRNEHVVLSLGTESIAIAGIDDITAKLADLSAALNGIPQDMPVLLASHTPDVILNPLSHRASLVVAGHTHGGQIRLPFIGSLSSLPTRLGKKFDQGLFQVTTDTQLAITRGVGESGPRARLFAPPEILLLEYPGREKPL